MGKMILNGKEYAGSSGAGQVIVGDITPSASVGNNGNIYCQVDHNIVGMRILIYQNRNNTNDTQLSEIRFNDGADNYFDFTGTNISSNKAGVSSSESVEKLIDNNVDTKFCVNNFTPSFDNPLAIYLIFASEYDFTSHPIFEYWTGNDAPERDPISFDIDGMIEYGKYIPILQVRNAEITTNRKAKGYAETMPSIWVKKEWYKANDTWVRLYS